MPQLTKLEFVALEILKRRSVFGFDAKNIAKSFEFAGEFLIQSKREHPTSATSTIVRSK